MQDIDSPEGPLGYVFAVADNPYCCWDYDHDARTLEFLGGIDPGYFGTVAELFASELASDDPMAISMALRVTYQHGVETLMSLLGAAAQAPSAIPAWIAQCKTDELKEIVERLRDGRELLTQAGRQNVTFLDLAEHVHRCAWADESGVDSTASLFGRFWSRLASEFLNETARAEYNAIKHGNRVVAGGFSIAVGLEETHGVPAPPEAMRSLGGSQFGSTFFASERVGLSKIHIRTRRTSINWSPEGLAQRLLLVAMSIRNVVSALQCALGVDPTALEFERPDPISAFDDVWGREPGVRTSAVDVMLQIDPSDELTKDQLRAILEDRAGQPER